MEMNLTSKEEAAREKIILPLDNLYTLNELESRVQELSPVVGMFKIGKESYTRFGPNATKLITEKYGREIFLDLKYHDIPRTVQGATHGATMHEAYLVDVHASGGVEMMKAGLQGAIEGAEFYGVKRPEIIAITMLTSLDEKQMNSELRIPGTVAEQAFHLAQLAIEDAGLGGIVCSPLEVGKIKDGISRDFIAVTPGIKGPKTPEGSGQKRVATPSYSISQGSNYLVIGSAITGPSTKEGRLQAGKDIIFNIVDNS